jgi:Flp pilus assembly protein TadG
VVGCGAPRRRTAGTTILETAFAFPAFILILLATFDVGYIFYVKTALQHAVREAGRMAQTGSTLTVSQGNNGDGKGDGKTVTLSRADSIVAMIQQQSGVGVTSSNITMTAVTAAGTTVQGAGGPGDVVTIRVQYQVALVTPVLGNIFPSQHYAVNVGTSFRNEEF